MGGHWTPPTEVLEVKQDAWLQQVLTSHHFTRHVCLDRCEIYKHLQFAIQRLFGAVRIFQVPNESFGCRQDDRKGMEEHHEVMASRS